MEPYMIFLVLQVLFFIIQIGFVIKGVIQKNMNFPIIWGSMILVWLMMLGYFLTEPD